MPETLFPRTPKNRRFFVRPRNVNTDGGRKERAGIPEVVFAKFKDSGSLIKAVENLLKENGKVLVTKCSAEQILLLEEKFKGKVKSDKTTGICVVGEDNAIHNVGSVAVVSAGSSDYFIAEEAALSAEFLRLEVFRHYDCGVAGIHRTENVLEAIRKADVVIVVAGMEGALPSVIGGLVKQPVIAVPTSVGYGTGMGGLSALMSMLNSCSPGIAVVNIDNGFGAAALAHKMISWLKKK
ncbi:nickel pincer cofactor biosynthesis protein LarB [archaeon]|nr:MAG: nickel pincer cofactor biosynthesis protein LarB [archaeon]